ncbi:hypothetical protein LNP10_03725 [Apilactobacillus nanyangensis]|uniref:D-alanyl-D-alanine carboxypeptidase n=1 Tax=Apilactobacillus nanyangensis TaxID=2799579 RepID=A0ABT0HXF5_9LACO|nr:hypothetical protein [Apilactobacillus nanyangensis]MCK8611605.1 hypothetical protein [Apilactobacillus nanyangensis]
MKKFKYVLVALVAFFAFTTVNFTNTTTANAKTHHSVRTHHSTKKDRKVKYVLTFPKNMRGTWYTRTNFYGKYRSKMVITKKSAKVTVTSEGRTFRYKQTLRKPLTKKETDSLGPDEYAKYANFFVGKYVHALHYKWLRMDTLSLVGDNEPGFLNIHKFNKHAVLTSAAGGPRQSYHYFRTDKLARKYAHKRFPHFNYGLVQGI